MVTKRQSEYYNKLKDPRWQKMRLKVLERDGWKCAICLEDNKPLAIHHRYYEHDKDPWEYPMEALVTLCDECHEAEKENMSMSCAGLVRELKKKFFSAEISTLELLIHEMPMMHLPEVVMESIGWVLIDPKRQDKLVTDYLSYLVEKGDSQNKHGIVK
jgi:hypothetical protein